MSEITLKLSAALRALRKKPEDLGNSLVGAALFGGGLAATNYVVHLTWKWPLLYWLWGAAGVVMGLICFLGLFQSTWRGLDVEVLMRTALAGNPSRLRALLRVLDRGGYDELRQAVVGCANTYLIFDQLRQERMTPRGSLAWQISRVATEELERALDAADKLSTVEAVNSHGRSYLSDEEVMHLFGEIRKSRKKLAIAARALNYVDDTFAQSVSGADDREVFQRLLVLPSAAEERQSR